MQEAKDFATDHDLLFIEASAKTAENVEKLYIELGKYCLNTFIWITGFHIGGKPAKWKTCI